MAAFDGLMEPVAVRLDYWRWIGEGAIPFRNFAAWFVVGTAAAAFHPQPLRRACDLGTHGRLAGIYVAMQAAFFVVLRIAWRWQGN